MALQGSITNADGTPSTYFVLQSVCIWPQAEAVDVTVHGYYSQATYESPCILNYTLDTQFTFVQLGIDGVTAVDVTQAMVYSALQTLPQFTGATVV